MKVNKRRGLPEALKDAECRVGVAGEKGCLKGIFKIKLRF